MIHLHQLIASRVDAWRAAGYRVTDYPVIAEIFEWARDPDTGILRFLRAPQVRALETYWYLRLVEGTPHIFTLYQELFPKLTEVRRFVREPERMFDRDMTVAQKLKELVLQANGTNVRRIILFGSRARGDARPDSDFDLLVVLGNISPTEKRSYRLALYRALQGVGVTVEPWVMEEEEFEETKAVIGGLAYPAWKEGVVLYENS